MTHIKALILCQFEGLGEHFAVLDTDIIIIIIYLFMYLF
jgi:hypothetical protein